MLKQPSRWLFLLLAPLCLPSCMEDDGVNAGHDSAPASDSAIAACECSELAASDVFYENSESGLVAETVQDAITEVAAAALTDVADRITVVEETGTDASDTVLTVGARCAGGLGTTLALGGGCNVDNSNATLVNAELRDSEFVCEWRKSTLQSATGTARVTCLSLNP